VNIEVRPATPADEDPALDLIEELFAAPGGFPPEYTRERGSQGFRWAVTRPDADVLLAFDGDAAVGLASVYADIKSIRFGPRCWLQDLVVRSDCRSQGVGAALLDGASKWAKDHGCTHIELSSGSGRVDAHRFYEREGMQRGYDFFKWLE
jgi:GNAT superfamily N-acetyltransferase